MDVTFKYNEITREMPFALHQNISTYEKFVIVILNRPGILITQ